MLSSFTLQMPMKVASNATEIATQVFRRARVAAVLSLSLGFLSSSSSTNCIGSGSMESLLLARIGVRSPTVREGNFSRVALPDGRASDTRETRILTDKSLLNQPTWSRIAAAVANPFPKGNLMRSRLLLSFVVITCVFISAQAQKRNITEKDLFNFVWIADPQVSPDGSRVAFVRVTVNAKKDGYDTAIWTVSTAGAEPRQMTAGPRDSTPRWSPDGQYLCFVRAPEK